MQKLKTALPARVAIKNKEFQIGMFPIVYISISMPV
jgi:hypothetical protein